MCCLLKSLNSLKQASRVWFKLLKNVLEEQGYTILKLVVCVAVKIIDEQLVFIPLYVDDLILFAHNMELINKMMKMFIERFEMKDLEELHYMLGCERTIFINQRKYATSICERFGMDKCNGCKTPCTADQKLTKSMCAADADEKQLISARPYRSAVGSLIQTEKTVALHTTEAEYMALSLLLQEVVHLRQMLEELMVDQKRPTEVYVDNESATKL
ncbi:unnamed protein product [Phytophthora fragariaefolia]|uniref:Unnamed protein product n=1 Tax=Phytophthora fragariaefolia TaxID=1490495 RepID=A0A9W6WVD8_9STRA|nr:unnamed protein product [Phytophthora fragariaefolia]